MGFDKAVNLSGLRACMACWFTDWAMFFGLTIGQSMFKDWARYFSLMVGQGMLLVSLKIVQGT